MITMNVDMKGLTEKLDKASKKIGESNKNAVARWGVQTCMELAKSTQPFGNGANKKLGLKSAKKRQDDSIEAGVHAVTIGIQNPKIKGKTVVGQLNGNTISWPISRFSSDVETISRFIDRHRVARGRRTQKRIPFSQKMAASTTVINKVIRKRKQSGLMAKGGWIGAAWKISSYQSGSDKIPVGKNFLSAAQKHAKKGTAHRTSSLFNPIATLKNNVSHSGNPYVLSPSESMKAIRFGLTKTIKWYEMTARRALK